MLKILKERFKTYRIVQMSLQIIKMRAYRIWN